MKLTKHLSFFLAIVALAAVFATTALAQEKGRRGGGGIGGFNLVTVASNEAVQKELGVSGDVAGKLRSLRDDSRAAQQKELQTAGINAQDFQNLTAEQRRKMADINAKLNEEFDPKVKELVGGDPYKRLQQIYLQANLRLQGPSALTVPQVAAELKLGDDQKQKLNELNTEFGRKQRELFTGGGGNREAFAKLGEERTAKTVEVLTAEQKEKLKTLQGSTFDVSPLVFGGRRGKGN